MEDEYGKWMILMATIWIQTFTGTNFDFSSYSSSLKDVLQISQLQLNCLCVASDMGKLFGWCAGLLLIRFPAFVALILSSLLGLLGYGLQWFLIQGFVSIPYGVVLLLCLVGGCSICWFNTVCYVQCIKNFPKHKSLALSLTVSFNGLSAAVYTVIANTINPLTVNVYLLLNATLPLLVSLIFLPIIIRQPLTQRHPPTAVTRDYFFFLILTITAAITGLYLLFLSPLSSNPTLSLPLLAGTILLLLFPFICVPCARNWKDTVSIPEDYIDLNDDLIERDEADTILGSEYSWKNLVRTQEFWLYYTSYLCGGTVGIVYANNLGQIAQSLGFSSKLSNFVDLYSSFSFFGRLLATTPDYVNLCIARTGWLAVSLIPMPFAFMLMLMSGSEVALIVGTAMVGLSSGFVFAAAISITSELFGAKSAGVNHNILITNIPVGSLMFGIFAAAMYDESSGGLNWAIGETVMCMGRKCFRASFITWGCSSAVGLASSVFLFLRTKSLYEDQIQKH